VRIELARRNGEVLLTVADSGAGRDEGADGTGLSIVRALVRDELNGRFELRRGEATRAEVVFPA
jgi:two-component sensor histidine kinase